MHDAVAVEIFKSQNKLREIHLRKISWKWAPDVLQQRGDIPTLDELHHNAQALLRLEGAVQRDHEGVVCEHEDVPFGKHLVHLIAQSKVLFEDFLHAEAFTVDFILHQVHRSTS